MIRTLNGVHSFKNQRYKCKITQEATIFLAQHSAKLGQERGYQSKGLMEFTAYYAIKISYAEVEKLTERLVQQPVYTARQVCNKIASLEPIAKQHLIKPYNGLQLCFNFVDSTIDTSAAIGEEIHYFDDGVGVKRQKALRKDKTYQKTSKTVQSDIIVLQKPDKTYHYIAKTTNTPNAEAEIEAQIRGHFALHYPGQILPFVAITDGATSIRNRIHRIFGKKACITLDWYHLRKKIWAQMSRLGLQKKVKEAYIAKILDELWCGNSADCLIYMEQAILPILNMEKRTIFEDLLSYLEKHQAEIIDYRTRYLLPKTIGSRRGEKANDQIVAIRQKHNGTAWSDNGSAALATLKCLDLNQQWQQFWAAA
jgi:hypothetical protein